MKAQFFIHESLVQFSYLERIAVGLAIYHDTGRYPNFLGHYGGFEQNPNAINSQLHKIHIALYEEDWTLKSWERQRGDQRTCDNFVIYTRHFFEDNCFQILDILTPNAHQTLNAKIPQYIEMAEQFHTLLAQDLAKKTPYSAQHQIAKTIHLTP